MSTPSLVPALPVGKHTERQVLRVLQSGGPLSRAEVARHSGMSAPTASKAVEALLRAGLLEEVDAPGATRGRPGKRLRLANTTAQVLGLVIDAGQCRVVTAGLDGVLDEERTLQFPTPETYEELIEAGARHLGQLKGRPGVVTHGIAVSVPGLVDYRRELGILSPNVPITNQRTPSRDLAGRLGVECVMVQEEHALCLAERYFGDARGVDDFAVLDVSTGVGLGVMSGGRLLMGRAGLAGEIGHLTMELDGRRCGCGNYGCLETVASDSALAWAISQRLGRKVDIDEVIRLAREGSLDPAWELARVGRYLAVALAGVINLFNPSTIFIHGKLFALDERLFPRVLEETRRRALPPSFDECRIVQARSSKRQGAIAAIVEHLTQSLSPVLLP
jgi:N-acetylglucosamine repressor